MLNDCELGARTRIRVVRVDQNLLLIAEGELPSPGFRVDIRQNPRRIFPQQFDLLRCRLPGSFAQVITPFRYAETVRFPADQAVVTVHHADGADQVTIEDYAEELQAYADVLRGSPDRPCPPGADEATGFSGNLSFDEAFADALANLPPLDLGGTADVLVRVQVVEIGGLFGGIAGFNDLFVRVCRTHD
jgi:flagellar biogenesis protein FliO